MILRDLRNKHRWSISVFLRHMVTAKSTKLYARTIDSCAKNLTSAIAQDEVLKSLKFPEKLFNIGTSDLIRRLRAEIDYLGASGIGLGNFDAEVPVGSCLDISNIYDRIRHRAPNIRELSNDTS